MNKTCGSTEKKRCLVWDDDSNVCGVREGELGVLVWGQNPERKVTLNILGTSWQPVSI